MGLPHHFHEGIVILNHRVKSIGFGKMNDSITAPLGLTMAPVIFTEDEKTLLDHVGCEFVVTIHPLCVAMNNLEQPTTRQGLVLPDLKINLSSVVGNPA